MKVGRITTTQDYDQDSTAFTRLASGNLSQRPDVSASEDGMIRFNSTTQRYEAFINGAWVNLISERDLTPSGFSVAPGENLTRAILNAILQKLNKSVIGSILISRSGYSSYYSYDESALPNWVENPTVGGVKNVINNDSNFLTAPNTDTLQLTVDIAKIAGVESQRFNYRYEAFSSIFEIRDSYVGGNFVYKTEMVQLWQNDDNDPNYGKFRITMVDNASWGGSSLGVRWYANVYKYKNFSTL